MVAREFEPVNEKLIGSKAISLRRLVSLGYTIPSFVTIDSDDIVALVIGDKINQKTLQQIAEKVKNKLTVTQYAVRSCALAEDGQHQSLAGQFRTELAVSPDNLSEAIRSVINQALGRSVASRAFSLIIQEFINPQISGVTFTRDPFGGREMVINYYRGRGDAVVGGAVTPKEIRYFWQRPITSEPISGLRNEVLKWQSIELLFAWPQDIEWCFANGTWHILQARPITSLDTLAVSQIKYLDATLPSQGNFYWEKNEITEIAPRPSRLTLSLLEKIYSDSGPVSMVYRKYGVRYQATNMFTLLGGELYCDKQAELNSVMPAYDYFPWRGGVPHFSHITGLLRTAINTFALTRVSPGNQLSHCRAALRDALVSKMVIEKDPAVALRNFLEQYQIIFEINFLASQAMTRLDVALRSSTINSTTLLPQFFNLVKYQRDDLSKISTIDFVGNSLDLADTSRFIHQTTSALLPLDAEVQSWWLALPNWKRQYLTPLVHNACKYTELREQARWLTVKLVSSLRLILKQFSDSKPKLTGSYLNFSIDEYLDDLIEVAPELPLIPTEITSGFLPTRIISESSTMPIKSYGVSIGMAEGKLIDLASVKKYRKTKQKVILYTSVLVPELALEFDYISGIVAKTGGLLSHLAILAREKGVPVVISSQNNYFLGDIVKINGKTGDIEIVSKE
ncbi:MAG: PEP/pyruvate-binding domain-containing protein [Candidatus Falkowbacteria bacterium]